MNVGLHRSRIGAPALPLGDAQFFGPNNDLSVKSLCALLSKETKEPAKHRMIRNGIFVKARKAPIKQIGAQLLFQLPKGPASEMFKNYATQETVWSNAATAKIH